MLHAVKRFRGLKEGVTKEGPGLMTAEVRFM
jgi:hypothetical protein